MNILMVVDAFMPSKISAAVMMYDLANEYKKQGHNIWVVTFVNEEEVNSPNNVVIDEIDGINVIRIVSPNKKKISLIKRGILEITSSYRLDKLTKDYLDNIDIDFVIEYSPSIMLSIFVKKLKKKHSCKSYLVLRDIFPAWARDLGVIKNRFVYSYFRYIEKQMYKNSDIIGTQSPKNKKYLLENNKLNKNKVDVLYNWVHNTYEIEEEYIDYRKKFNLGDKIVFLYGGNIGKAQQLEFLLELAKEVDDNKEAIFLIVGDGVDKEKLVSKYKYLNNVIFENSLEPKKYEMLVKQCDVGLVNLNKDFKTHNIPGKLLTYWSHSKPVLAAVNSGNDLFEIINNQNGGLCIETGCIEDYKRSFLKLINSDKEREYMGENGKNFAECNFSVSKASKKILMRIQHNRCK
ncbi:glycosyltransferase family 4 protein [Paraclostridium bifermentans]|uniref:glycosyltransferase family 4 protein n=1 Tax=Paraclostridium bifermentans TaxID=1490 RepID=UPI0025B1FB93|nr:glycosyltransferase family 4 protein [Paraclostridium bifermentans]